MRTPEQAKATQQALRAQLMAAQLSEPMRRALLSAHPAPPEPEWDSPADYCQGHESLAGAHMGLTVHCDELAVCDQARRAYDDDHRPDPGRLVVTQSSDVTVGTIVALLRRQLVGPIMYAETNYHELTDEGLRVREVLETRRSES